MSAGSPPRSPGTEPSAQPPRISRWLLGRILPAHQREFAIGDLHEEFERRRDDGLRAARRWYRREALRSATTALRGRAGSFLRSRRALPAVADGLLRDGRFAFRALRRRPGHGALIVLTLAIGIGAATAVFTVVDRALFRDLPYRNADELFSVWNTYPGWRGHHVLGDQWDRIGLSWPEFERWRREQRSFEAVAAYAVDRRALTGAGDPAGVRVGRASASLWTTLGIDAAAGRLFTPGEEGSSGPRVAVLSHAMWRDRFGGATDVGSIPLVLDGVTHRVVGVLPEGFSFGPAGGPGASREARRVDVWIPAGSAPGDDYEGNHAYESVARLAGGRLTADTRAETLRLVTAGAPADARGVRITARQADEVGEARSPLLLLFGGAGLLMLLASVNVGTLMLGRISRRRGELATRAALGAGRGRLIGQMLAESTLLGVLGAAGGIALGTLGLELLLRWAPPELALPADVALDARVLAFAILVGLAASLLFGLLPALLTRRLELGEELRRAPSRLVSGSRHGQQILVAAQFALSLVLLVATGLLARSLANELSVDPGFEHRSILTLDLSLPGDRYGSPETRSAFLQTVTERLTGVAGVEAVTGTGALPFSGGGGSSSFEIAGQEVGEDEKKPEAARRSVLPGFHETLGIPVLRGRSIGPGDRDGAPGVAVVSRSMEGRFWPEGSAIGERIVWDDLSWEIVGVVGDIHAQDRREDVDATFYVPFHQVPGPRDFVSLVIDTSLPPSALGAPIRDAVWSLDPALPLDRMEPLAALVDRSTAGSRYRTGLLSAFALIATCLAAVGVFGATTRSLVERAGELGVRTALGAGPRRLLLREILREAVPLAGGLVAGLAAALALAGAVRRFLFGVPVLDPLTFGVAAVALGVVGMAATALAARRVLRLDPVRVLRTE